MVVLMVNVYGSPALQTALSSAVDMLKVMGAASENAWAAAVKTGIITAPPNTPAADIAKATEVVNNLMEGLERVVIMQSGDTGVKMLNSDQGSINVGDLVHGLWQNIAAAYRIPIRVLLGTEEAKLAGEADQRSWENEISILRREMAEEVILEPLINRLIETGTVRDAKGGYKILWGRGRSSEQRADLLNKNADALVKLNTVSLTNNDDANRLDLNEAISDLIARLGSLNE